MNENALYLKFHNIRKELKGFYNCSMNVKGKKYSKGFELIVVSKYCTMFFKSAFLLKYYIQILDLLFLKWSKIYVIL